MKNCEFVTFISVLACSIAKGKTQEELNVLSAFFSQLRRYLSNSFYIRYWQMKLVINVQIFVLKGINVKLKSKIIRS